MLNDVLNNTCSFRDESIYTNYQLEAVAEPCAMLIIYFKPDSFVYPLFLGHSI